jgi:site-specific recombinase XerD
MNKVAPIKDLKKLEKMKEVLKAQSLRNWLLAVMGLNTLLRIQDLLDLTVEEVFNINTGKVKDEVTVRERKTNKDRSFPLNAAAKKALKECWEAGVFEESNWLFPSPRKAEKPLTRQQAHNILKKAAEIAGIKEPISCHSLRKTMGYHLHKKGTPTAVLTKMYNHSSERNTMHYLGIEQEDINKLYKAFSL